MPNEIIAGYIPVLHQGYTDMFNRHPDARIGVLDESITGRIDYLRKDIRALEPELAKRAIQGLGRESFVLNETTLNQIVEEKATRLIMPNDDVSKAYFFETQKDDADVIYENIFLRWDRRSVEKISEVVPDKTISLDRNNSILVGLNTELTQSSNWWRHVGAVIVDEGHVVLQTHNSSVPTPHTSLIESDPRILANKGDLIEQSIDIHAEARAIAEASKAGISLEGKDIYVTTFPCPNCAKLIAFSGIKTCYYIEGYSMLDGYSILKNLDVEVVKLDVELEPEDSTIYKKYPTS